jgi:hypothetical protein
MHMHKASEDRISGSIRTVLFNTTVNEFSWIDLAALSDKALHSAANALHQQKRALLTEGDAVSAVFDAINRELRLRGVNAEHGSVKLVDVVSREQIEEIAAAATSYLGSLPRALAVDAPFIQIENVSDSEQELIPGFAVVSRENKSSIALAARASGVVGVSKVRGIPTTMFSGRTLAEGFDKARTILGIWMALDLLLQRPLFLGVGRNVQSASHRIADIDASDEFYTSSAELDRRAAFIGRLAINRRELSKYLGEQDLTAQTVGDLIAKTLGRAFLDARFADDSRQISSASHWLFESEVADDESSKFVFCCIGIEAIAGGGDPNQPLGQRISDRVSYLLCKRPSQRKDIADKLTAIFKVRGKIVHG